MQAVQRNYYPLLLAAIMLVGAWLRLRDFDLSAFNIDEAIASIYSIQFIFKGDAPMVGVKTSLHFYNSPLLIYLLAPFFSITTNPLLAQGFVAALGIALIGLVARIGREAMGRPWGLMLAVFVAFSIIGVDTSRRLWGHSFIPFLSTLVFYHTWLWIAKGRAKSLFIIPCAILWAQQLHFSGSLLWVNLAALWLIFRPRFYPKYFTAGFAVGALPYIPYLMKTGLRDLALIAKYIVMGSDAPQIGSYGLQHSLLSIFGEFGRNDMLGDALQHLLGETGIYILGLIVIVFFYLYSLLLVANKSALMKLMHPRKSQSYLVVMCFIWLLVPNLAFSILNVTFVPFYLLPALPAPFILFAMLAKLAIERQKASVAVVGGLLALWIAGQIQYHQSQMELLRLANSESRVQTCLRYRQQAVRWILQQRGESGGKVFVMQAGMPLGRGIEYSYTYLFWRHVKDESATLMEWDGAERVFIIRDSKDMIPDRIRQWLESRAGRAFGNLTVYEIIRAEFPEALFRNQTANETKPH